MLWEYLREEEFEEAIKKSNGLCLLPIGCFEKHGQHLPVGADTIIAGEIVKEAAEKEYAVVFPTYYFGEKSGAGEFKGTVLLSHDLKYNMLKEFCNEIYRNGFKKILICNGHGGNPGLISQFTRNMLQESNNYQIMWTNVLNGDTDSPGKILERNYDYLTQEDKKLLEEYRDRGTIKLAHACFIETAVCHHYKPDAVRLDKINQEDSSNIGRFNEITKRGINSPLAWMADVPNSYDCDSNFTTNERISRAICENSVQVLAEKIKFLKEETISDEFFAQWRKKQ